MQPAAGTGLLAYGDNVQDSVVRGVGTGRPLWHFNLSELVHEFPMNYALCCKQCHAVAVGNIFVFTLPAEAAAVV
jgi:hypothetical protein